MKRHWLLAPLSLLLVGLLAACAGAAPQSASEAETAPAAPAVEREWGEWRNTDPYSPYPERIVLNLVKGGQEAASLLPEGESIEENRALQYIEDVINADIQFAWVVPSDSFGDKLNLAIASGDIPDAMVVSPLQLQQLAAATPSRT